MSSLSPLPLEMTNFKLFKYPRNPIILLGDIGEPNQRIDNRTTFKSLKELPERGRA